MKAKIKKYLQVTVRLIISLLALYLVFRKTDLAAIKQSLMNANLYLILVAALFFVISKIISAVRLNEFFSAKRITMEFRENIRLYWLGMFYNLFLPGGIGGDGYKVFYLRRKYRIPVKSSFAALVLDRVTGLYALLILCLIFLFFIPIKEINWIYIVLAIILTTIVLYLLVHKLFHEFYTILSKTNLQSLGVQVSQVIAAWMLLIALGGEQRPDYLFVFLVSSVVAVIPFTIGGIGARELTFLYAARILNLDLALSVSLSMLFFLITVVVSLFGAVYVIRLKFC